MTARQEWAAAWPMPIVAMLGITGSAAFAFSAGVFMEPMTTAFGWSRTQYSAAFVIQMLATLVTLPVTGQLTRRFGPRKVVLVGIFTFSASFALLGSVGGALWQWWGLCILLTAGSAAISQVTWVTALIGHFQASRGLAISVALAGLGLGTIIWPPLALAAIALCGWRLAFGAMALLWAAIMLPLTLRLFRDPPRAPELPDTAKARRGVLRELASPDFLFLLIAGGSFSGAYYGVAVNLVPILKAGGIGLAQAAAVAGALGVFAIIGRPVVGQLLDRLPTRPIAVIIFLLPAAAVAVLLSGGGKTLPAIAASAILGFSAGGEMDVVTFVAARRFGRARFATLYSVLTPILAVFASLGPLAASMLFDTTGSYRSYLFVVAAVTLLGAAIMAVLPLAPGERLSRDAEILPTLNRQARAEDWPR